MLRFIPACAGNTVRANTFRGPDGIGSSPPVRGTRLAHLVRIKAGVTGSSPPVRGTHEITSGSRSDYGHGSSPPVRGTHCSYDSVSDVFNPRFIPACAGNTVIRDLRLTKRPGRFIPACAGNTPSRRYGDFPCTEPVHPRLCGEHPPWKRCALAISRFIPACAGNTRQTQRRDPLLVNRFIPACAGNTWLWVTGSPTQPTHAVHPRLCGEHSARYSSWAISHGNAGSSPPVRGTLALARRLAIGAGSSPPVRGTPSRPGCRDAVHPRLCGEHSPLFQPRTTCSSHRFIPACAGNTACRA